MAWRTKRQMLAVDSLRSALDTEATRYWDKTARRHPFPVRLRGRNSQWAGGWRTSEREAADRAAAAFTPRTQAELQEFLAANPQLSGQISDVAEASAFVSTLAGAVFAQQFEIREQQGEVLLAEQARKDEVLRAIATTVAAQPATAPVLPAIAETREPEAAPEPVLEPIETAVSRPAPHPNALDDARPSIARKITQQRSRESLHIDRD